MNIQLLICSIIKYIIRIYLYLSRCILYGVTLLSDLPYPHLLNFFDSSTTTVAPELHRLLDYVGVPSRFVDSETQACPTNTAAGTPPGDLPGVATD